jgi:hypothetical protein
MEAFIFIKKNSICHDLCNEIISKFEEEPTKHPGFTLGGIHPNVKDTIDFVIPSNCEKWYKINKCLLKVLTQNIDEYIDIISNCENYRDTVQKSKYSFTPIHKNNVIFYNFMLQRYTKNQGRYIYHDDSRINVKKSEYRIITYLWYLNDVEEGGETVFWNDHKIKPEKGKLILFPACWTFPHCGRMPISSNKYIITGWIYQKIGC